MEKFKKKLVEMCKVNVKAAVVFIILALFLALLGIGDSEGDVYLLADHTKIGKNSSFTSSPIQGIKHLITDEKAPQDVLDELRSAGVLIHQVHKGDFEI